MTHLIQVWVWDITYKSVSVPVWLYSYVVGALFSWIFFEAWYWRITRPRCRLQRLQLASLLLLLRRRRLTKRPSVARSQTEAAVESQPLALVPAIASRLRNSPAPRQTELIRLARRPPVSAGGRPIVLGRRARWPTTALCHPWLINSVDLAASSPF